MSKALGAAAVLVVSISLGYVAVAFWNDVTHRGGYARVDVGR